MIVLADFSSQLPALARQEVGFLYFALLIAVLFASDLVGRRRQATIAAVLAALVVSHYSTSYVAVVMLGSTWLVYGVVRLLRGRRRRAASAPVAVRLVTVALGVAMILAWDVGVTSSSSNVTNFISSLADKGVQVLPYARGSSVVQRYLDGNVGGSLSPAQYYAQVAQESRATQPWLNPFPKSVTDKFPARAAPPAYAVPGLVPGTFNLDQNIGTGVDEVLLVLTVAGVAVALLRRKRQAVPVEVAIMLLAFLGFLVLIRFSGTVAGSYNADRAQLQAAIVLAVALGLVLEAVMSRLRFIGPILTVAALVVMLANGTGESAVVTGADAPVLLANGGTAYDYFVISQGEVSAAQWMVANAGRAPDIYTDEYGALRIWDATGYIKAPSTWLTPATISQGAWVYAPAYAVVDDRAYGTVNGLSTTYAFPAQFLGRVDNLVYSDPTGRVYQ
jgi:uncharacterized membrane protein